MPITFSFYLIKNSGTVLGAAPMSESDGFMMYTIIPPKDRVRDKSGRYVAFKGFGPIYPAGITNMLESGDWDISESSPFSER